MTFTKGALSGQATTDASGAFSLPVPGAAAADFTGGLVALPAGAAAACVDALTGLPPPFTLGALVPEAAGVHSINRSCLSDVGQGLPADKAAEESPADEAAPFPLRHYCIAADGGL